MGICSLKLKDYELALEYFGKALIIAPDNAYILNNIGIVYSCKKEHDIAINYFKKALN
jgi:tetratricopeptide (TPR) repeat protein